MATTGETTDNLALDGLRRRGQILISSLLWAAAGGAALLVCVYLVIIGHFALELAERFRTSLGGRPPDQGVDVFLLAALLAGPSILVVIAVFLWSWYRRIWNRKLREVWPDGRERARHAPWNPLAAKAGKTERLERAQYLSKLRHAIVSPELYEHHAEMALAEMEKEVAERALATGLIVGVSHNRFVDLFTIFAATLEMQLHVLSALGKRPSWHTWRLLVQRCGASLFINSYLNRQDLLLLNLLIKKAGMGLHAAGDLVSEGAQHLDECDMDLDDALGIAHGGMFALATKGIELGATMAMTVGQVGLHTLGSLIESVGDELAQGSLAAGIIYYHGISLAADTLALDRAHRESPAMNRNVRDAIWKMGEVAGAILLDFIRQRRNAFREKRQQLVRGLPKAACDMIYSLFGKKAAEA